MVQQVNKSSRKMLHYEHMGYSQFLKNLFDFGKDFSEKREVNNTENFDPVTPMGW